MRRLFIGDLHGCLAELEALLKAFSFDAGQDRIYSVGDIIGRGPDALGCLQLLTQMKATVVCGNHEAYLLHAARLPPAMRSQEQEAYASCLGNDMPHWLDIIGNWPTWVEMDDVFLVHAGLEPGHAHPRFMRPHILQRIRTWDGRGDRLNHIQDPPWFECQAWPKTTVFGHWAQRGLIDRPGLKGLDTGCVYGRLLTGWCPEEDRFIQVAAKRAYASLG